MCTQISIVVGAQKFYVYFFHYWFIFKKTTTNKTYKSECVKQAFKNVYISAMYLNASWTVAHYLAFKHDGPSYLARTLESKCGLWWVYTFGWDLIEMFVLWQREFACLVSPLK